MKTILLSIILCCAFQSIGYAQTADVYFETGYTKEKNKDFKGALEDYKKAVKLNPNDARYHFSCASMKEELKDLRGALADYNKAITLAPNDEVYLYLRASVKERLKDYKGALEDLSKAIQIAPKDAPPYAKRGDIRRLLKDKRGAIEDYNTAILLEPQAEYYFLRGIVKYETGDRNGGCGDIKKAKELGYTDKNKSHQLCE